MSEVSGSITIKPPKPPKPSKSKKKRSAKKRAAPARKTLKVSGKTSSPASRNAFVKELKALAKKYNVKITG